MKKRALSLKARLAGVSFNLYTYSRRGLEKVTDKNEMVFIP